MPVAALFDIHGNLPALEAVLDEVDKAGCDVVVIGGDVVSGPMPVETLARLQTLGDRGRFIRGNADRVLEFYGRPDGPFQRWKRGRLWVADRLGPDRLEFLAGLPTEIVCAVEGLGEVLFSHGAPGSDEAAITPLTTDERLLRLLKGVDQRVVVCGHTHIQFDRSVGSTRVINAGSVGFPYEAEPGAYWLLLGRGVSLRRTPYDVDAAASLIRATGYPNAEKFAEDIATADPARPARLSALIEASS